MLHEGLPDHVLRPVSRPKKVASEPIRMTCRPDHGYLVSAGTGVAVKGLCHFREAVMLG